MRLSSVYFDLFGEESRQQRTLCILNHRRPLQIADFHVPGLSPGGLALFPVSSSSAPGPGPLAFDNPGVRPSKP